MMAADHPDLVLRLLRDPATLPAWSPAQWDLLVRQARAAGLLARLGALLARHGQLQQVPPQPAAHFESARRLALAQRAEILREVEHVRVALQPLGLPLVLLKGAAYLLAELPAAEGRLFADTDILVPKPRIDEVEAALTQRGWGTTHHSAYDQRYYRQWMHELPPLVHLRRQTALDVHHAIAPETARLRPDPARVLESARPIPGKPGLFTLDPPGMVLHSMLHLNVNDDLSHTLRDLSDLDLLLRHFGTGEGFWAALRQRATDWGLNAVLDHAVHWLARLLGTPVPAEVAASAHPPGPLARALWSQAMRTPHRSTASPWTGPAQGLLYLRAHGMRMPPVLLARHLAVKAWMRLAEPEPPARP